MVKVSIIIPIYNAEKYIEKCLKSIENQSLKDIQVVLVNDGSTDKTEKIIDEYVKKYPNKVNFLVYGTKDKKLAYPFKFIYNVFKSLILYIKIRPKYIVTTGTHTAVPICYIGKLFGTKIIFIETFANSKTKTLSGKMIYPIANLFIVQWESMLELYPRAVYGGWIY